ncbi:hypothetical protein GLW08_08670 [Pontibacillus yanchengensis]|uniref:Uncharacterized protein n=2 Tax=Pontibacillus yanchengensis TaxID=462910 RepID=A0ACC7VH31_9BACI|nr:hypothetical protein [Pontibacillus yanchengensis]MYL33360.1 hypothetical protein [Pontibacillus yanchengensis]MYL53410.1 hypothetical protein [Pontibacillus yanchengensis]
MKIGQLKRLFSKRKLGTHISKHTKYNITYKKDDVEKYIQKWSEGEEVTFDYGIEGLDIEENPQIRIFRGYEDYWELGVTNNSVSEPYTKEDEFEAFIKLDGGQKETFSLSFNKKRTEDLKNIEGNVINNSLKEPIGEQGR